MRLSVWTYHPPIHRNIVVIESPTHGRHLLLTASSELQKYVDTQCIFVCDKWCIWVWYVMNMGMYGWMYNIDVHVIFYLVNSSLKWSRKFKYFIFSSQFLIQFYSIWTIPISWFWMGPKWNVTQSTNTPDTYIHNYKDYNLYVHVHVLYNIMYLSTYIYYILSILQSRYI